MRRVGFSLLFFCAVGCGRMQLLNLSHNLPGSSGQKITPVCLQARSDTALQLYQQKGFVKASNVVLAGGTCAVQVTVDSNDDALPMLQRLKALSDHYNAINENGRDVPVWMDESEAKIPPTFYAAGKTIDNSPLPVDCQLAANRLNARHLPARFTSVTDNEVNAPDPCYVEGTFSDAASFEGFFKLKNPDSFNGEILHVHHRNLAGTVATVRIHVVGP